MISTGDSTSGRSTIAYSDVIVGLASSEPPHGLGGLLGAALHLHLEALERLRVVAAHRATDVARVHALDDARELPVPERDVVVDLAEVAVALLRVPVDDLLARQEPLLRRRRGQQHRVRVVGLGPIDHQQPHVGERVAERADLPVEHRDHVAVGVGHAVVEPVVAVNDGGGALLRDLGEQRVVDLVDQRQLTGLRLLPLPVPALQLPLDVVLLLAEVTQADSVGVDGMDLGHRVGDGAAGVAARLGGDRGGGGLVAEDEPVDEGHDVERRAVHLVIGAEPERRRDGHVRGTEGGDDLVLAPMSCAVASTWPSGGRRSTKRAPWASVTE